MKITDFVKLVIEHVNSQCGTDPESWDEAVENDTKACLSKIEETHRIICLPKEMCEAFTKEGIDFDVIRKSEFFKEIRNQLTDSN